MRKLLPLLLAAETMPILLAHAQRLKIVRIVLCARHQHVHRLACHQPFWAAHKFLQQSQHPEVPEIGVFSCGPAQVNKQIRRACMEANRFRNAPSFVHRFEAF
ncbi:hypothetical protein GPALN_002233 [Globodera pallida]|nr:hypothetical protein GPALN_002233 [Globodera pallida]